MLVTVRAEPGTGCDAILVQDTKGTERRVLRVSIAAHVHIRLRENAGAMCVDGRTWRKQMYGRSSTSRGLRDHARRCGVG